MIIKVNDFDEALTALEAHKRKLAEVGYCIADGIIQNELKAQKVHESVILGAFEYLARSLKETAAKEGWEYIPVYFTFEEDNLIYIYAVGIIIQHEYNKSDVEAKCEEAKRIEKEGEESEQRSAKGS